MKDGPYVKLDKDTLEEMIKEVGVVLEKHILCWSKKVIEEMESLIPLYVTLYTALISCK